jgi:hypothetical protein
VGYRQERGVKRRQGVGGARSAPGAPDGGSEFGKPQHVLEPICGATAKARSVGDWDATGRGGPATSLPLAPQRPIPGLDGYQLFGLTRSMSNSPEGRWYQRMTLLIFGNRHVVEYQRVLRISNFSRLFLIVLALCAVTFGAMLYELFSAQ